MIEKVNERIGSELNKQFGFVEEQMSLNRFAEFMPLGDKSGGALFVLKDNEDDALFEPNDRFKVQLCHVLNGGEATGEFGEFRHRIDIVVIASELKTLFLVLKVLALFTEIKVVSYNAESMSVVKNYLRYVTDNPEIKAFTIRYILTNDTDIYEERNENCCE